MVITKPVTIDEIREYQLIMLIWQKEQKERWHNLLMKHKLVLQLFLE